MTKSTRIRLAALGLMICVCVACSGQGEEQALEERQDRQRQQERAAWYERQQQQDCAQGPFDEAALTAVRRAFSGDRRQAVHGDPDPYNRRARDLANLRTRPNPGGEGVLVTSWVDLAQHRSADYSRRRSVWLVLDRTVYPINTNAAGDIGRLHHGLPADVQKRSGLTGSYQLGVTPIEQLGFEGETFRREFLGGNPFPNCIDR